MTVNPKDLDDIQDKVFADKQYWPQETDSDEITFCNLAALAVAHGLGCHDLDRTTGSEPYTADQLYNVIKGSSLFSRQGMDHCQKIVNAGALIFAILPSWLLKQSHGHICTVTPGIGDHSGRWNCFTPLCLNLGRSGTCFRARGVNWAFQMTPEFYMWGRPE